MRRPNCLAESGGSQFGTSGAACKAAMLERARRIERLSVAWNAAALPLSYTRSADNRARYAGRPRLGIWGKPEAAPSPLLPEQAGARLAAIRGAGGRAAGAFLRADDDRGPAAGGRGEGGQGPEKNRPARGGPDTAPPGWRGPERSRLPVGRPTFHLWNVGKQETGSQNRLVTK